MSSDFDPYYKWLGIPADEQPPNHYRLLGVKLFETDLEVIAAAANQRYIFVQYFQSGEHAAVAEKILAELKTAGHCLLDKNKKSEYDRMLKGQFDGRPVTGSAAPTVESLEFVEPMKVSKFIKSNGNHQRSQIWSTVIGILMLLGIVVAIVALQRNLRDINRVATDRHTVEANDTKPTAESKPLLAHNNPPKSKKENHWDGNSTRPIFKTTPKKPVEKREPPALPENESPKIEDALQLDFQPQNNNLPINNPQTVQPVKMLDLALDNLPSGKKFAADVFNTDMGEVNRLLNADLEAKQLLIAHYPNGNTVLAAHKHGVLDGVCIFFTKKGKPTALINYRNGLLQGVAKTWNEQGERLLCFEYAHGARNGFCCYYKDGRFRLLLEIYANKIRGVYLISSGLVEKSVDHAKLDDLDADAKDLVKEARTRIYSAFNRNEKILKMQCAEEYMRLQRELANLMRSKGLKAVENRVRDYNNQCKKRIDSLGKYEFLKKSVW